jgi:FixJ family two-component response regulator
MSVRAIKGGAYEFLTKPVESSALIDAIESALKLAQNNAEQFKEHYALNSAICP